jgi:hypothetical protein
MWQKEPGHSDRQTGPERLKCAVNHRRWLGERGLQTPGRLFCSDGWVSSFLSLSVRVTYLYSFGALVYDLQLIQSCRTILSSDL